MSRSVPSTSYLLATEEMSGLFLMFWPLARQVTLGKGWPVTPQWTRWLASFSFTVWDQGSVNNDLLHHTPYLSPGSVSEADGLHDNKIKLDIGVRVTGVAADVFPLVPLLY